MMPQPLSSDEFWQLLKSRMRENGMSENDIVLIERCPPDPWVELHPLTVSDKDASSFDFHSVLMDSNRNTSWFLRLGFHGIVHQCDISKIIDSGDPTPKCVHVSQMLYGPPTDPQVVSFVKRALATVVTTYSLPFPLNISVSSNLAEDKYENIRIFLTSLPSPTNLNFHFESSPETAYLESFCFRHLHPLFHNLIQRATLQKALGNKELKGGNRKQAVLHYKDALAVLNGLILYPGLLIDYKSVLELTAMCYGNISAAWAVPGPGQNLTFAGHEAENAISMCYFYAKGYFRLSKAYELMGDINGAMDAITGTLMEEELRNDTSLAKRLIELQTGGKGLPTTRKTFDDWMKAVMLQDRMRGVTKGAWMNICADHRSSLTE